MKRPVSILIVDDHRIFRDGIASMLNDCEEVLVKGFASNGVEALGMIPAYNPDILLLDLSMPLMGGLELLQKTSRLPEPPLALVLSMHTDVPFVHDAIKAGARGYISKEETDRQELLEAIRTIAAGQVYYCASIKKRLSEDAASDKDKPNERDSTTPFDVLSKRETEVLKLVLEGMSNQEIADATFVSIRTVETHKNNIMNKLNLKNTVELVKYAIQHQFSDL
jgi:DNA-binding NarL/FixJ family response regulator